MRKRANLVSDFLERATSSNQLSSELPIDDRVSPHQTLPPSGFIEHMISSRAVRFPSPHETGYVEGLNNEIYEPFLNQ